MKVLIAEDEDIVRESMRMIVLNQGHEVVDAVDGRLALALFGTYAPDLVISDLRMPNMDGFELLAGIRKQNAETIVVIMTGESGEDSAVQALRLGANNYLTKPVQPQDLVVLLQKYENIVNERALNREINGCVIRRHITLRIDNRIERSTLIARYLAGEVRTVLDEKSILDITLGLDELIMNAIEHGNLGITYDEKNAALNLPDGLERLHAERCADPRRAARRVKVDFVHDSSGYVEWIVEDEGEGFDWLQVPNPLEENRLYNRCGRGIFLTRIIFDEMEYLGAGNIVRARKYLKPAAPAA